MLLLQTDFTVTEVQADKRRKLGWEKLPDAAFGV